MLVLKMITSKIDAIAACLVCFQLHILFIFGIFVMIYFSLCTQYWYLPILYYIWVCYIDKETPEQDGRRSDWIRSLPLFRYARNYFPIKFHLVPGLQLDPKRNYLSCAFPHGFAALCALTVITSKGIDIHENFPKHRIYGASIKIMLSIPFLREFALALGLCSASAKSIGYHLGHPEGGRIVGLLVGGASEVFYCHDGQYRITLKNRKGFVKLALTHGAPLIPIFTFGETSILKQKVFPEGSLVRAFIEYTKKLFGVPFVLVYGRGLFQGKLGLIPFKHPINMVAGMPIEVAKIENPTKEDIDLLHQKFVDKLTQLFEEYKYKFEKDPTTCKLVIA